jgi:mannan endo-1,4-beta-mannosidase
MDGSQLKDPCGADVLLRGVNKMAIYMDRAGNSFPEIAKTGANTVRIMWFSTVPAADAVATLQRAIDSGLIPIWQMHDTTGDFAKMPLVEAFWRNPAPM